MVSYTLKAGGDVSYTLKAGGDVSYTLKAGGDGRLHTEGWRRWSATH